MKHDQADILCGGKMDLIKLKVDILYLNMEISLFFRCIREYIL